MKDDTFTTGALFLGGGVAGYLLGREVIARWLDRPSPSTSGAPAAATTPPPATAAPTTTNGTTAPPSTPAPAQARPATPPSRPRRPVAPRRSRSDEAEGPITSPSQVESTTPPIDAPITSPSQAETTTPPIDGPVTSPSQADAATADRPAPRSPATVERTYYERRAAALHVSIPLRVTRTRELIAQWTTYLDRYRGGLPRGVFAAVMQMESDGHPRAKGDDSLGEVGLFQITKSFPRTLGFDPKLRYHNEWNFYFAGAQYNQAAWRWHRRHPDEVAKGSREAWLLARLSFAIGDGAARSHVRRALQADPGLALREGAYAALLAFVQNGGARAAGSQSAAKVAYRIAAAVPINFEIGEQAEPGDYDRPMQLTAPKT